MRALSQQWSQLFFSWWTMPSLDRNPVYKCTLRRWRMAGRGGAVMALVGSECRVQEDSSCSPWAFMDSPVCGARCGGYAWTARGPCWVCGMEEVSLAQLPQPHAGLPRHVAKPLARGASCCKGLVTLPVSEAAEQCWWLAQAWDLPRSLVLSSLG